MPIDGTALGVIGYLIILAVLLLVISKKLHVIPTLILVPVVGGLIAGYGPAKLGEFAGNGLSGIVGITAMFAFAVWYFSIMRAHGMFDPLIARVIDAVIARPVLLTAGTVVLGILTHLDGSGATTMLVTIPAMVPFYDALNVDGKVLAALVGLTAGAMNIVPWGGVVVRAVSALDGATIQSVYNPMLPAQVAGLATVFGISLFFSRRVGDDIDLRVAHDRDSLLNDAINGRDPTTDWRWGLNVALTVGVIGTLVFGVTSPALTFMLGVVLALILNVPDYDDQEALLEDFSADVMTYVGILLAAGVLIGILDGSGMITEMASILLAIIPDSLGNVLPVVIGLFAMPFSMLFSPDAFYFGVLPVLAETAAQFGFEPVVMARAAIVGQMTVGFPISPLTGATFLLIGLADVELGEHIKFTFPLMWLTSLVILAVAILTRAVPIVS